MALQITKMLPCVASAGIGMSVRPAVIPVQQPSTSNVNKDILQRENVHNGSHMGGVYAPTGSSFRLNCNSPNNLEAHLGQGALKNCLDCPVEETPANVTKGTAAYQHIQSNVTHDVHYFRETQGRKKSCARLTTTCVTLKLYLQYF